MSLHRSLVARAELSADIRRTIQNRRSDVANCDFANALPDAATIAQVRIPRKRKRDIIQANKAKIARSGAPGRGCGAGSQQRTTGWTADPVSPELE